MKEHIFKSWDSKVEEWFYSDKEYDDHFFEFKNGVLKCFGITANSFYPDFYECELPVQFTGEKNKQGERMFEGDIVNYYYTIFRSCGRTVNRDGTGIIIFDEACFKIMNKKKKSGGTYEFTPLYKLKELLSSKYQCEIIGTKSENPELLLEEKIKT